MTSGAPTRLCFVCLGNLCRSPTAMAVMAHHVDAAGLADLIVVECAGTAAWHVGDPPDPRAVAEAHRHGIEIHHRGRQFRPDDFSLFDLVLAMDHGNVTDLEAIAPTHEAGAKIRLLRSFDPAADGELVIPDPYYGGPDGFAAAFELIDASCRGLLAHLAPSHG